MLKSNEKFYDMTHPISADPQSMLEAKAMIATSNKAIKAHKEGIEVKPSLVDALWYKATALADLGRHAEALGAFNQAIELNPESHLFYHNKGLSLYALGEYPEAIKAYDAAIGLKPGFGAPHASKELALSALGEHNQSDTQIEAPSSEEVVPNISGLDATDSLSDVVISGDHLED